MGLPYAWQGVQTTPSYTAGYSVIVIGDSISIAEVYGLQKCAANSAFLTLTVFDSLQSNQAIVLVKTKSHASPVAKIFFNLLKINTRVKLEFTGLEELRSSQTLCWSPDDSLLLLRDLSLVYLSKTVSVSSHARYHLPSHLNLMRC